ncbi:hypothetical protein AAKU67_000949 [Oxalobacteraceae bacterium GrIS 2.11]
MKLRQEVAINHLLAHLNLSLLASDQVHPNLRWQGLHLKSFIQKGQLWLATKNKPWDFRLK